jgi:hypothetical protein
MTSHRPRREGGDGKHPDQRDGGRNDRQRAFQEATDFRAVFACKHFRPPWGCRIAPIATRMTRRQTGSSARQQPTRPRFSTWGSAFQGREAGRPWVQYRNGGKPAEMLIRYHRDVSAASRTEPRSNPIWGAVRSQTIEGVSCLAVGRPLPAGRGAFRAHWGGRPTTTSGDTKWRPSAGAADEHRHIASGAVSRSCAGSGQRASSIVQHRAVGAPFQPYTRSSNCRLEASCAASLQAD